MLDAKLIGIAVPSDVLKVDTVEMYSRDNAREHRTDRYELVRETASSCVLRRGQPFFMALRMKERNFDSRRDNLRLSFNFGTRHSIWPKIRWWNLTGRFFFSFLFFFFALFCLLQGSNPQVTKGTKVVLPFRLNQREFTRAPSCWDIRLHQQDGVIITLQVIWPSIVSYRSRWWFSIVVDAFMFAFMFGIGQHSSHRSGGFVALRHRNDHRQPRLPRRRIPLQRWHVHPLQSVLQGRSRLLGKRGAASRVRLERNRQSIRRNPSPTQRPPLGLWTVYRCDAPGGPAPPGNVRSQRFRTRQPRPSGPCHLRHRMFPPSIHLSHYPNIATKSS